MANDTTTPHYGLRPREESALAKFFRSPVTWIAIVALVAFGVVAQLKLAGPKLPAESYGEVSGFEFTDHTGAPFAADRFRGKVSIVNFIFTSCPDVCPILTKKMRDLQLKAQAQGLPLQFVSISVDPKTDTPPVLKQYAETHGADLSNWFFLTGPINLVQKVIVESFKVAVERGGTSPDANPAQAEADSEIESLMQITHGEQFALVDPKGQIRAYRRGDQNAGLEELLELSRQALAE